MAEAEAWVMIPKLDKDKTGCVLDMRPLVLCKDCKYCFAEGFVHEHNICDKHKEIQGQPDDWFCADGERK